MKTLTLVRGALCAILGATMAGPALAQPPAPPKPAASSCFLGRNVNNFVAVDNRTVNIRVGVRQFYQLKLFTDCIGIGWSQAIALGSNPGAFICTNSPQAVDLYIHTTIGRQRCPVTAIRKLSDEEVAAMPRKQRP